MTSNHILKWGAAAGAGALAALATRRLWWAKAVLPELRGVALMPTPPLSLVVTRLIRRAIARRVPKVAPGVRMSEHRIASLGEARTVRLVSFERSGSSGTRPALLWIHGGGYIIGTPEHDMAFVSRVLDRLDVLIVSVDYRLAPEHPFPAPLDDCYTGFRWLIEHAADLQVDVDRIAIGGQSAGGGLAAGLVQRVVDTGPITPAFQFLLYPMLDAKTTARHDHGGRGKFVWTPKSNRFGWASYLGRDPSAGNYPDYAVPASRANLTGLPPAWIGVGTLDLFHDEDVEYGARLTDAGVRCVMHVTDGGFHAFDVMMPEAVATSRFYGSMLTALAEALDPDRTS